MIFYVFYSNSSLLDSLENAVSEHLEWLKFQKFSRSSTPKLTQGDLQWPPADPSAVPRTAYGVYGAFKLKI